MMISVDSYFCDKREFYLITQPPQACWSQGERDFDPKLKIHAQLDELDELDKDR
jgi:hypothetical protein